MRLLERLNVLIGLAEVQELVSGMRVRRDTIMNVVGTLRSILSTGKKWGYSAAELSPSDLVIPKQSPRAVRFFTPERARLIIGSAEMPWKTAYAIAAMCGLRPGEVLGLKWDEIGEMEIHVHRSSSFGKLIETKTVGSAPTVPLPQPLREILDEYRKVW